MYLEEQVIRLNKLFEQLEKKRNIAVWGAAENTVRLFQDTSLLNYDITEITDIKKAGKFFFGKILKLPEEIDWERIEAVVVSSFYHEDEIEQDLRLKYGYAGLIIKLNETGQTQPFYQCLPRKDLQTDHKFQDILKGNKSLKDIHKNERIFILCCGPSIQQQDLTLLKDEITMAVSSFYMHKDLKIIQPNYYCNAQWARNEKLSDDVEMEYLKELHKNVGHSRYFFAAQEKELIENSHVFDSREVNYYYYDYSDYHGICRPYFYQEVDLCQEIMPVHSVPVLCIQLALYMGFKEIYLLGTEHDSLLTNQYTYFYDKDKCVTGRKDVTIDENDRLVWNFSRSLADTYRLWENYKTMKRIADAGNVKIYNATAGGALDLFPRVDYYQLFSKKTK